MACLSFDTDRNTANLPRIPTNEIFYLCQLGPLHIMIFLPERATCPVGLQQLPTMVCLNEVVTLSSLSKEISIDFLLKGHL